MLPLAALAALAALDGVLEPHGRRGSQQEGGVGRPACHRRLGPGLGLGLGLGLALGIGLGLGVGLG